MFFKEAVEPQLLDMIASLQSEPLLKTHVLAGGTALALQIGHRRSTDIDLFSNKEQNNGLILEYLQKKYGNYELFLINKDVLRLSVKGIKIDIIKTMSNIIDEPLSEDGITLFGKKDIAAMKLRAIMLREKNRDFIDIAYLMKEHSLQSMLEYYQIKYGTHDVAVVKTSLLKCRDIKDWNEDVDMLKNDMKLENMPILIEHELNILNRKKNIGIKNIFKSRRM